MQLRGDLFLLEFNVFDGVFKVHAGGENHLYAVNHRSAEVGGLVHAGAAEREAQGAEVAQIDAFAHEQVFGQRVNQALDDVRHVAARERGDFHDFRRDGFLVYFAVVHPLFGQGSNLVELPAEAVPQLSR